MPTSPTVRPGVAALALLAAFSCVLTACGRAPQRGDATLALRISTDPAPPSVGPATVIVDVAEADWRPRNGDRVVVTGRREGIDLVTDTAQGIGAGRYRIDGFPFEVSGRWTLVARVETRDGRWAEREWTLEVGAGG